MKSLTDSLYELSKIEARAMQDYEIAMEGYYLDPVTNSSPFDQTVTRSQPTTRPATCAICGQPTPYLSTQCGETRFLCPFHIYVVGGGYETVDRSGEAALLADVAQQGTAIDVAWVDRLIAGQTDRAEKWAAYQAKINGHDTLCRSDKLKADAWAWVWPQHCRTCEGFGALIGSDPCHMCLEPGRPIADDFLISPVILLRPVDASKQPRCPRCATPGIDVATPAPCAHCGWNWGNGVADYKPEWQCWCNALDDSVNDR